MNKGYIAASLTVLIWGLTFVSTKILLTVFTPVEILFIRFAIGFIALLAVSPKRLRSKGWQEEKYFILAGLTGIFFYYFLENASMLWTGASNAGVIVSTAPFFTALFSGEKKSQRFFLGFVVAILGIVMISFSSLDISIKGLWGDFLALLAAAIWGIYAIVSRKISTFGYPETLTTRRSFLYGLVFIAIPLIFWNGFGTQRDVLTIENIGNLIFLGVAASALCFVLWNIAVRELGAVKTSVFIYLVPVITVLASVIFLNEELTLMTALGTVFTLLGLFISSR